jgi:hypothetical protein
MAKHFGRMTGRGARPRVVGGDVRVAIIFGQEEHPGSSAMAVNGVGVGGGAVACRLVYSKFVLDRTSHCLWSEYGRMHEHKSIKLSQVDGN